jgi:hypothetical protein
MSAVRPNTGRHAALHLSLRSSTGRSDIGFANPGFDGRLTPCRASFADPDLGRETPLADLAVQCGATEPCPVQNRSEAEKTIIGLRHVLVLDPVSRFSGTWRTETRAQGRSTSGACECRSVRQTGMADYDVAAGRSADASAACSPAASCASSQSAHQRIMRRRGPIHSAAL